MNRQDVPILFIVFNRSEQAQRVFSEIRKLAPHRLWIAADGPRVAKPGEREQCIKVRELVSKIDWPCQVRTDFLEQNVGCKLRVSSAITWALTETPEIVILEDDTVPDPSFFDFMAECLDRYRDNERVMMISGVSHDPDREKLPQSYYFSRFGGIWGWATWRRAWSKHYDVEMKSWPTDRDKGLLNSVFSKPSLVSAWSKKFQSTYDGMIDTWDHQWTYCMLKHGGLSLQPTSNLITNIGFGEGATHTKNISEFSERPLVPMKFPMIHPREVSADQEADQRCQVHAHSIVRKVISKISTWI